jgi:crossover junction endodeoxyribonuclease RusA
MVPEPTCLKVELPWPSAKLSPNARLHWGQRSTVVRNHRALAKLLAFEAGASKMTKWVAKKESADLRINVQVEFIPPAKYRYDEDGLMSRMKAYLDGIADALGADDYRFQHNRPVVSVDEAKKPGMVRVTLS